MAVSRLPILTLLVLAPLMVMMTSFPSKTEALIPYSRSPWDMMLPHELDPFKILEQTPLALSKNLETLNLARADWKETANEHVITLDVPGMKRDEIKIEVEENRVLRVSGERKAEEEAEGDKWHRAERTSGKFWRQFRLPGNADVDHIRAHMEDGVLRITVPKLAEEKRKHSKVIDIVEQGSSGGEDIKATKASA